MRAVIGRGNIIARIGLVILFAAGLQSCGAQDVKTITLAIENRSLTKIPYFIALDQNLFEKHGLKVELSNPPPDYEGAPRTLTELNWWTQFKRSWGLEEREFDMFTQGGTPLMLRSIANNDDDHRIAIGSTDCAARAHLIGRKGLNIEGLQDLKGMRLGATTPRSTTGLQLRLLASKLGWDPDRDFTFVELEAEGLEELAANQVDAIIASEIAYAEAVEAGYPILFDLAVWNEPLAGNSITVSRDWLANAENREAARRLMMALGEATHLYHADRELALRVLEHWTGMPDAIAKHVYDRGAWLPRKPYPCRAGYEITLELYDSPEVRAHHPEEFFDDSIVREIDDAGFFDALKL